MRPIYAWALNQVGADKNGNLIKAINMLDESKQEAFIDVIVGADINDYELPKKIIENGVVYTLCYTNYLNNDIYGEYMGEDVRYFATQDAADVYASTGNYEYNNSTSYSDSEKYTIKSVHPCLKTKWFSYGAWMNAEVVVEDNE